MFPTELMMVRKTKKGDVKPVFLSEDSSDLCKSVTNFMKSAIGTNMHSIDHGRKEMELKSGSHKIIRSLFLIMERLSRFEPPSPLEADKVRMEIFSRSPYPVITTKERNQTLTAVAGIFGVSPDEISNAFYADKDSEQVLKEVPDKSPEELAKIFNLEQIETLIMHSTSVIVNDCSNWYLLIRRIKSLGLLFTMSAEKTELKSITVSGPASVLEKTERYGIRLSQMFRYLYRMDQWSLEAIVQLRKTGSKTKHEYTLKLGDDISEYLPGNTVKTEKPELKYNVIWDPEPLELKDGMMVPYCAIDIDRKKVFVNLSIKEYLDRDRAIKSELLGRGITLENVYITYGTDRKIPGETCFKEQVDWEDLEMLLEKRYGHAFASGKTVTPSKEMSMTEFDTLKKTVDNAFPDSARIVEAIQSSGFPLDETLYKLGYKIMWDGLDMKIIRNANVFPADTESPKKRPNALDS